MVDLLNVHSIDLAFPEADFYIEDQNSQMPELKRKKRPKLEVPHFPNVDVPMKEEEILNYKQKKNNKSNKPEKKEGYKSERIKLKQLTNKISQDENNDENQNEIEGGNSIVGDRYIEEDRTNNYIRGYTYHKLGNCHAFCADSKGNPLIIISPKWYKFFVISLLINSLIWFYLLYYGGEFNPQFKLAGVIIVEIFQWTYLYNFVCNPGFPKNNEGRMKGIPKEKYKFCSECFFYVSKKRRVKHCFECGICVEGYHHHASWLLGKCVGRGNRCMYYIFILSLVANAVFLALCISIVNS